MLGELSRHDDDALIAEVGHADPR